MQAMIPKLIFLYPFKFFFKAISALQLLYTILKYVKNASLLNWFKVALHLQDIANLMYTVNFPTIIRNMDGFHVASCILLHICFINFS